MLDMVDFNHVQHISFTQSRLTDAVSVILNGLLSYEHPPNQPECFWKLWKRSPKKKCAIPVCDLSHRERTEFLDPHGRVMLLSRAG